MCRRGRWGAVRRDGSPPSTAAPTRSVCWSPSRPRAAGAGRRRRAPDGGRPPRPGRRRHRRDRARGDRPDAGRRPGEYAAPARARRRAGAVRRDLGLPGRRATRPSSWTGVRERLAPWPASSPGGRSAATEEAALSFRGATARAAGAASAALTWSSTSAAGRPRSCAAATTVRTQAALRRHRLRAADRAAPALRPADRGGGGGRKRRSTRALDEVARAVDLARRRHLVGLAGSVTTITAQRAGSAGLRPRCIHLAALTGRRDRSRRAPSC